MPREVTSLGETPKSKIITAKNQEKLMGIFKRFPDEAFTQHELHEQTQIMYPASVHSALMALVKKGKISRHEQESDARKRIVYQLAVGYHGQGNQPTIDNSDPTSPQH
jgi:hypothetical protein